jgi:hypothetical protein
VEAVDSPAERSIGSWLEHNLRRLVVGTLVGGATGWFLGALLAQIARGIWADSFGLAADDTGLYHGLQGLTLFGALLPMLGVALAVFVRRQALLAAVGVVLILALGAGSALWAREAGRRAVRGGVVATSLGPTHLTSLRLVALGLSNGTLVGEGEDSSARYRLLKLRPDDEVVIYDLKERRSRSYPWSTVSLLAWFATDGEIQSVGNPCAASDKAVHPDWDRSPEELCRELQDRE